MHELTINGDRFHIPGNWNDFTPSQFMKVAELALKPVIHAAFKLKLLLAITGLRVLKRKAVMVNDEKCFYLAHGFNRQYLVGVEELASIGNVFNFMLQEIKKKGETVSYHLECKLVRQLIPEIKIGGAIWVGPSDGLNNLIFSEYIHAETAFSNYSRTGKQQYINQLVAILYRPEDINEHLGRTADQRERFNDALIHERADVVNRYVDRVTCNAILMWYEGCRHFLAEKFPEVFSYSGGAGRKMDVFESFLYLVNALTDNDVTKTEQVRQSYLYEVMVTLNAMALQRIQHEKEIKEMKKR